MKTKLLKKMRSKIISVDYSVKDAYEINLITIEFISWLNDIERHHLDVFVGKSHTPLIKSYQMIDLLNRMFETKFVDKLRRKHVQLQKERELRKAKRLKEKNNDKVIYKF